MSERIIDLGAYAPNPNGGLLAADVSQLREEIVRCRDCEHRYDNQCGRYPDWFDIELDGFCKWGERIES